jgi:hypothetical protein
MTFTRYNKAFTFFCILFISQSYSAADLPNGLLTPTKKIIKEYQHKVSFAKTVQQIQDFCPILIEVLHELFLHAEYWKTQQLTPFSYFLSKDPTKWIYRKQEWKKIDSCLEFLDKEQEHNAYYIGLFRQFLQSPLYSEQKFMDILQILESCLGHYPCVEAQKDLLQDLEKRVERNECLIKNYKKNAQYAVAHCSKPNHFQRNWLTYFLGTSATVGLSYFLYKNKAHIQNWGQLTIDAVKKFWDDHVSSPILKALKSLFDQDGDPLTTKEAVEARRNEDLSINKKYFMTYLDYSPEKIEKVLNQVRAKNPKALLKRRHYLMDHIFMPDTDIEKLNIDKTSLAVMNYAEKTLNWVKGVKYEENTPSVTNQLVVFLSKLPAWRELFYNCYIELHNLMLQKEIATLELEKVRNAQAINAELAAILPSALLVFITYSLSKKIFTSIVLQKNTYQPLRKALRSLHRIYNKYQITNADLSIADLGYCYYWFEQFKKHVGQINLDEHKMILEDLAELESVTYKPSQKVQTIQRMYYNYHFLLPLDN